MLVKKSILLPQAQNQANNCFIEFVMVIFASRVEKK